MAMWLNFARLATKFPPASHHSKHIVNDPNCDGASVTRGKFLNEQRQVEQQKLARDMGALLTENTSKWPDLESLIAQYALSITMQDPASKFYRMDIPRTTPSWLGSHYAIW